MPQSIKDARAAVLAEREQIAASIRDLEGQLKEIDSVLASLDRIAGSAPAGARTRRGTARRTAARPTSNGSQAKGRGRRGPRAGSMASTIESYLQEQGRKATHMDQIMEHLEQASRAPGGKNPKGSLRTTLYQLEKAGRIRNIGKNRWRAGGTRRPKAAGSSNGQS
jgi:hypothetical protein